MTRRRLIFIGTLLLLFLSWILAFYATIPDKVSERIAGRLRISESTSQIVVDEANYTGSDGMFDRNYTITLVSDKDTEVTVVLADSKEIYSLYAGVAVIHSYEYEPILLEFEVAQDVEIVYDIELKASKYKDPLISILSLVILMAGVASGRMAFKPEAKQKQMWTRPAQE